MQKHVDFARAENLDQLYGLLGEAGFENGWNKREPSLWPLPRKGFLPAHWSFAQARSALAAAGKFVSTETAERRNLILANPLPNNHYPTVRTLVAAYQMVKANETARSHRHTPNALRLALDCEPGVYTIVNGEKIPMEPGDVLLTPNWHWHGHSNESTADAYWIDFLDAPLVQLLGPMFLEQHPDRDERADAVNAASPARFAWKDTVKRLASASEMSKGVKHIELGSPALRTVTLHVLRIEAGAAFSTASTTASSIFAAIDGEGDVTIDGSSFVWKRGDVLAAPTPLGYSFHARSGSHLLRVSDEPVLSALGWLKPVPAVP